MDKQTFFTTLHSSFATIKTQLAKRNISIYDTDLMQIQTVMDQFPILTQLHIRGITQKKEKSNNMLQAIFMVLENFERKVAEDLKKEEIQIENEMQGTQNYSEYELRKMEAHVFKKKLQKKLKSMMRLVLRMNLGIVSETG